MALIQKQHVTGPMGGAQTVKMIYDVKGWSQAVFGDDDEELGDP
jgi:hypothetical protein